VAQPRCICLTAPTASGKTELALAIAERFPIEIVSMDSAMVFRGMDIGTAKPSAEIRAQVPHHLIDICDPSESYSAGRFVADTVALAAQIEARGNLPLIVGGTMMYLRALRSGLAELPSADAKLRAQIDAEAAASGWPALHAELAEVDPESAQRIRPNDRQRIQRALEIWRSTGRSRSAWLRECAAAAPLQLTTIALLPEDRAALHARIEARFDAMLAAGLVDEVRVLHSRNDLSADLTALRSVGYRQILSHLDGEYSLPVARERAIAATRQLAKRQLTWLRSDPGDIELAAGASGTLTRVSEIIADSRAEGA
jgi:tRNA dimethylallyltransferase